jgi:hypothetical protein
VKPGAALPAVVVVVSTEDEVVPLVVVAVVSAVVAVAGVESVVAVVEVAAAPQEASSIAPASNRAVRLIATVYVRSQFAFTSRAYADEREVGSLDFGESVGGREVAEPGYHLVKRDVDRLAARLAYEVLVVPLPRQMDDRWAVAQVYVMEYIEAFEDIERSIYGGLIDPDARRVLGPLA